MAARGNDWFTIVHPRPLARLRVVFLPFAGGGTAAYRAWSQRMPRDMEAVLTRLPGRESRLREAPHVRLDSLIQAMREPLLPFLDRPFVLFGHSFGALLALQLARALRAHRNPLPTGLVVSGRPAPQLPSQRPHRHLLTRDRLVDSLRKLNGIPAEILEYHDLLNLILPTIRADLEACETWQHRADLPLSCPIIAAFGDEDPETRRWEMEAWAEQTRSRFVLHHFKGDHFYIFAQQDAFLPTLFHELRRLIDGPQHALPAPHHL